MDNPEQQDYGVIVKASKVKEILNDQGYRMSSDYIEKLNSELMHLITKSGGRCMNNQRQTVFAKDL